MHATYLINLASPDDVVRQRSAESLLASLRRAAELGARGVVVHTGSAVSGSREAALVRMRETLLPVLDALRPGGPELLLEPMAGQGRMLCGTMSDLAGYLEALDWHPRAEVCLDTCHVYAAGHDLSQANGVTELLTSLQTLAPGRLKLIHANDSADPVGSRRDRHAPIGGGTMGLAAFAGLLSHPATAGIPFIVETPGGQNAHDQDVAALKQLRPGLPAIA